MVKILVKNELNIPIPDLHIHNPEKILDRWNRHSTNPVTKLNLNQHLDQLFGYFHNCIGKKISCLLNNLRPIEK